METAMGLAVSTNKKKHTKYDIASFARTSLDNALAKMRLELRDHLPGPFHKSRWDSEGGLPLWGLIHSGYFNLEVNNEITTPTDPYSNIISPHQDTEAL